MSVFVRKISRAKWPDDSIAGNINNGDISADAITACLRTAANTLSVWSIPSEEHLEDAVLAILAAGEKIETIDVAQLSPERLHASGIEYRQSAGETKVLELVKSHFDLVCLTYGKLGIVAQQVLDSIVDGKVQRFTIGRLKEILRRAIEEGRLSPDELSEKMKKALR